MSNAKKLKELVKGKPSFGTDPNEPWSAKANITESGLNDYLLAKGINPKFVSKDTKISHAKSSEFAKWKRDHQTEEVELVSEDALLMTYLKAKGINPAYVSKEQKIAYAKSGAFLKWKQQHMHEQVFQHSPVQKREHMLKKKARHGDPVKTEEVEQVTEWENTVSKQKKSLVKGSGSKPTALERFRSAAAERAKESQKRKEAMERLHASGGEDMKGAIDRLAASLKKEETVEESEFMNKVKKAVAADKAKRYAHYSKTDKENRPVSSKLYGQMAQHQKKLSQEETCGQKIDKFHKKLDKLVHSNLGKSSTEKKMHENLYQDGAAATQTNFDGANSPDNTEPYQPGLNRKREMTKSARIIKSIYKKKGIKEELYDHEKEDKSVASYGKKPKLKDIDPSRTSDDKPQAAAVLSGGTTMTGEPRDTLVIDPEMKRPLRFDKRK